MKNLVSFGDNEHRFPRLIAFFGPDGAGKSTHAQLMVNYLTANGFKVKKAWVRSVHSFAFLLWILLMKLNLRRDRSSVPIRIPTKLAVPYVNEDSYGAVSPIAMTPPALNGPISCHIWSAIEFVSLIPILLLEVYVPLLLGYVVVAERYVVDSVATVAYFLNDLNFIKSRLAKLLLGFVPKGAVFFFIDADYGTIVGRRGKMAGPPDYTEFHRRVYNQLASVVGAICIDTSKLSIKDAHETILNSVVTKTRTK